MLCTTRSNFVQTAVRLSLSERHVYVFSLAFCYSRMAAASVDSQDSHEKTTDVPDWVEVGKQVFYYSSNDDQWRLTEVTKIHEDGKVDTKQKKNAKLTNLKPASDPLLQALTSPTAPTVEESVGGGEVMLPSGANTEEHHEALSFMGDVDESLEGLFALHTKPHAGYLK